MKRYVTDASGVMREERLSPRRAQSEPEMRLVKVYQNRTYQGIIGFGAALTEASGYVFAQMDADMQDRFLQLCFGDGGNRYSLARLSIQSNDFSLVPRSYLTKRNRRLEGFSIDDDWAYVLPLVKRAQAVNPSLQFLASPWSPPAWAKTNRAMKYGGHLRRGCQGEWARMIAETLRAYAREGVNIGRITIQNEPQACQTWESCLFNAEQEREFLHEHLKPALREAGLGHVKTLVWDHNKEGALDRALAFLADGAHASDVDGVAFHWYSGDHFEALQAVRELVGQQRELIFTEGCDAYSAGDVAQELPHAEHYAHELIGDLQAGANGVLDWNILLNAEGGPNHVGNFCDAPIMYDTQARQMKVRLPFHYLGHFSRFIAPGARRTLSSRFTGDLETCAFANPDGTFALVVLNRCSWDTDFTLACKRGETTAAVDLQAPAHSIQTICW